MRPPIIGLTGKARTGKDTVCQFIISRWSGYRYGFADPLKSMLFAGFGINLVDEFWASRKEQPIPAFGKSPREMLQTLGTEWGRNMVHPDVWLLLAHDMFRRRGPGMIVTDCRFENEATWIRDRGGIIIHVARGEAPGVNAHASENGVVRHPADKMLLNNSTLEDLRSATYELLEGVMGAT